MRRERLILGHKLALGDTVLFTGLVRDVERAYPGRFEILVDSNFGEIWHNHPIARRPTREELRDRDARRIEVRYRRGIGESQQGRRIHMLRTYHEDVERKSDLQVPLTEPCGDLHLRDEELEPIVEGRYWLLIAGAKQDMTTKFWWESQWQILAYRLRDQGLQLVQSGAAFRKHHHFSLDGTLNLVGEHHNARDFINLIANAEGVICPVTSAMHIAACYDVPCVVLGGGREEPWWYGYTNEYDAFGPECRPVHTEHRLMHTLGQLDCCNAAGCWRRKTVPRNEQERREGDRSNDLCLKPVLEQGAAVPRCMDLITPAQVEQAVLDYYPDGRPAMTETPRVVRAPRDHESRKKAAAAESGPSSSHADHPIIGGRVTACVLCYGPHEDLARSCLGGLFEHVPASRLDVRVGLNAVCEGTRQYVRQLEADGWVRRVYEHPENAMKYPVMREMFYDQDCPIETEYVLWLDDDTRPVDPRWFETLCRTVVQHHDEGGRLYGWKMLHDLRMYDKGDHNPYDWFQQAPWWQRRHLRVKGRNAEAPNGTVIEFVAGWCWAIHRQMIYDADVPDRRLGHNGGDIAIAEQVHQAGGGAVIFNKDKQHVWCPPKHRGGRRGYEEPFPWSGKRS